MPHLEPYLIRTMREVAARITDLALRAEAEVGHAHSVPVHRSGGRIVTDGDALVGIRRHLLGYGAILLFIGGVIGFGFLFFLIGRLELWPLPGAIDYQMPGTYDAWRMAHMEAIVNGFGLWLAAAILPLIPLGVVALRRVGYGLIVVAWTFAVASSLIRSSWTAAAWPSAARGRTRRRSSCSVSVSC